MDIIYGAKCRNDKCMNNGFIGKPIINNNPGRLFDIGIKSSSD